MKQDYPNISENEDQAWDLLGNASQRKASPDFLKNVMESVHSEEEALETVGPDKIVSFKPYAIGIAAALALLLVPLVLLNGGNDDTPLAKDSDEENKITPISQPADAPSTLVTKASAAIEIFSDEDIYAMMDF